MDFDSPDVMKEFPGLYASDAHKTKGNDADYSDDADKLTKKDLLIGKRKDKKDKKDKDRGYAALEGESSAEENFEVRSPSKSKKTKSFKFPTKSKEKREKSRDKDKDTLEKKKDKDKKVDKRVDKEKEKTKVEKKERKVKHEDYCDIGEVLPIFGVNLKLAVERGHCHDGINIPLPVRECIEHIENYGLTFENVYKVSSPKSKVNQLKKLYNQREIVNLSDCDIPTVTGLLKAFLRDLSEPIFTTELLPRFEEAGAILNVALREKHLKILVGNLPEINRLLLAWIIVHLYNVTLHERYNKMNAHNMSLCMNSTLQVSQRLATALLCHCPALFPNFVLEPYIHPLASTSELPTDPVLLENELLKQESLLTQIHAEMNIGCISKQREELLWEVQRITTQLKRKLKIANKDKEAIIEKVSEEQIRDEEEENLKTTTFKASPSGSLDIETFQPMDNLEDANMEVTDSAVELTSNEANVSDASSVISSDKQSLKDSEVPDLEINKTENVIIDRTIENLQSKNILLNELKQKFIDEIEAEKVEISSLKAQLSKDYINPLPVYCDANCASLDEIMDLLSKENQILQIKKINLVRQIMEQEEACIDLKIQLEPLLNC